MVQVYQHYLECLSQASYSIISNQKIFIVDPKRDVQDYIELIEKENLHLVGVMLTHLHADFVAGHQELAKKYDVPIYIGKQAQAEYPHQAIEDGKEISFGEAKLVFWETPGHTPGDVSTVLYDTSISSIQPKAVFTGDTLFNGDVGRPDLLASFGITKEELVIKLYGSLQRLMTLPDSTVIYPAHGAGSLCGKSLGTETFSTIGKQRSINYAVKAKSLEEFSSLVTTGQESAPAYFKMDAVINKKGLIHELSDLKSKVKALSVSELNELLDQGEKFQFLDSRDSQEFAKGFIKGFINIGLDGRFASWAGTILNSEKQIILLAPDGREDEVVTRLARVGFDNVYGFLEGGIKSWVDAKKSLESIQRLTPQSYQDKRNILVLDVRTPNEISSSGMLPNSINIPLSDWNLATVEQVKQNYADKNIVTLCAGGYRSIIAASLLRRYGINNVVDVESGYESLRGF